SVVGLLGPKLLANRSPDLIDFPEDLVSLEAAKKIQLKALAEEMLALSNGLRKARNELEACANDGYRLEEFIGYAEAEVRSVTKFYHIVGKSADGLALYFSEDPARCPFEQAIQTFSSFVRLFQECHEENLKQAERERKKAEKEASQNPENNFSKSVVIVHK
ncbi:hypothetical protein M8C21_016629, partial [Ambrosia artemisiifolia]